MTIRYIIETNGTLIDPCEGDSIELLLTAEEADALFNVPRRWRYSIAEIMNTCELGDDGEKWIEFYTPNGEGLASDVFMKIRYG